MDCNSCADELTDNININGIKIDYHMLELQNEIRSTKILGEDFDRSAYAKA